MSKARLSLVVLFLSILSFANAGAAVPSNVNWTTSVEQLSENEGVIRWHAEIKDGWHIYGLKMPSLDTSVPPPTSFDIDSI